MWLAGAVLVGMMLMACANMVLRAVWEPLKGTYELMGFGGALVTAFGLAGTQLVKGHIALTIMAGVFPRRVERAVDAVANLGCGVFFALVAWRTALWSLSLVESGELSETLRFAYYPFPFAVAFGCLVLAVALLSDFVDCLPEAFGPAGRRARA
ncbi:MAG: TRAP transporter small permease [Desulfovibrionaceae bacterium]|nr:TRAP transporter small permease [Desulfovibrionaceae bacterium]